ncbi:ribosome maturation factor RimP [Catenuloplanes japonicus]|uniref:ribosome maturation factor RimP n=1 Tax=Catenuloplanes japonicus TaxID=33876 RepID=UPI000527956D|nr:ribosome maturation factor RimP [Catenuloplanes japonicus]
MTQRGRGAGRSGPGARGAAAPDRRRPSPGPQRPRVDTAALRARLESIIGPVVAESGCDLEDLTVSRAGRRQIIRILLDADGGVGLDAIAQVSRAISAALDEAEETGGELVPGEYQLEVGSPGVDRPLTLPRHWRRNVGRLVQVTAGDKQVTGRITAADEDGVVIETAKGIVEAEYAQLGPGRVQIEFNRVEEAEFGPDDEHDDDEHDDDLDDEDDEDDEELEGEER